MEVGRESWNDDRLDARFEHIDRRFDDVDTRFDRVDARFDRLDERLDRFQQTLIVMLGGLAAAVLTLTAAAQF